MSQNNENNAEAVQENGPLPNDARTELLQLIDEQKKQILQYRNTINSLETTCQASGQSIKDLEVKHEFAIKQKEHALKEKELMVVRYAVSEKNVLQERNAKENAEKALKELQREHELVNSKLTMMINEKARICQILDNKTHELKASNQEVERLRQDLGSLETKLKWSHTNLRKEIELRKHVEEQLAALQAEVQSYVDAAEKAKKDADEAMKAFHTSQENRAHVMDVQNKEQAASLILLRHEVDERDQQQKQAHAEMLQLRHNCKERLEENDKLSKIVHRLETERADLDVRIIELQNAVDEQRSHSLELAAVKSQLEQLQLQVKTDSEQLKAANEHIDRLKDRNKDLTSDMDGYRSHESELLTFTQQLTDKNVALQSDFTLLETKVQQLTYENGVLSKQAAEALAKTAISISQSENERNRFTGEIEKLENELKNAQQQCDQLTTQLSDQQGENNVIKRKHELSLREVSKELAQCRKRIEQYEIQCTRSSSSSSTSLNASEENAPSSDSQQSSNVVCVVEENRERFEIIQPQVELDHRILIEHIAKLQHINAKKSEKLDFMEEHVKALVGELQKKGRLLQHYMKSEQPGTMSSNTMDSNKAILIKHSGTMASIHSAKVTDENLSIEQVLDINRKLYAVLEDALLKNITLKENIDTLGGEIEKLQRNQTNST